MDKREIICLHIGQAGLQIGSAVWELFRVEHEITQSGEILCFCPWPLKDNLNSLYNEYQKGIYKPRAILIDSEPMVIDDIKSGIGGKMFDIDRMIHGDDDAMSIFAKGYNSCAQKIATKIHDVIQSTIESSGMLNGFILFHSLAGGTGSGLTHKITEMIQDLSDKKAIFNICITPTSFFSSNLVEPYNTVLSTAALYETSNLVITMENSALYKSMKKGLDNLINRKLNFSDINRKVARISSCITIPYRFNNKLSTDFGIYQTNLIPFKGLHFPIASYCDSGIDSELDLYDMTKECFENKQITMNIDNKIGSYLCSCCLFRGVGCSPSSVNKTIQKIKDQKKVDFVDWIPTGFKIAISNQVPGVDPQIDNEDILRSVCVIANHSAITQNWRLLIDRFNQLLSQKTCLHWFLAEGIEEDALEYAKEIVNELITQYEELDDYNEEEHEIDQPLPKPHETIPKAATNKNKLKNIEKPKIFAPIVKPVISEPIKKSPVLEPIKKVPVSEPIKKAPVLQPIKKVPEPIKKAPVLQPIKKVPFLEPIKKVPVLEPVKKVPVLEPVKKVPVLEPVKKVPVLEPVKKVPVLEPVKKVPVLEPVKKVPVLEPVKKVPVLEPVKKVPVSQPSKMSSASPEKIKSAVLESIHNSTDSELIESSSISEAIKKPAVSEPSKNSIFPESVQKSAVSEPTKKSTVQETNKTKQSDTQINSKSKSVAPKNSSKKPTETDSSSSDSSYSSSSSSSSESFYKNKNKNANAKIPNYFETGSLLDLCSLNSRFSSSTNLSQSSRFKSLSDALQNSYIRSTLSLPNYIQSSQIPKIDSPEKAHQFLSKFCRLKSKLSIKTLNKCDNQNHVNCLNISLEKIKNSTIFETNQFLSIDCNYNEGDNTDELIIENTLLKSIDYSICLTNINFFSLTCLDLSHNSIIIPEACINNYIYPPIVNGNMNDMSHDSIIIRESCINNCIDPPIDNGYISNETQPNLMRSKPFVMIKRGGAFILSKFKKIHGKSVKKGSSKMQNCDESIFKMILDDIIDEKDIKNNTVRDV